MKRLEKLSLYIKAWTDMHCHNQQARGDLSQTVELERAWRAGIDAVLREIIQDPSMEKLE